MKKETNWLLVANSSLARLYDLDNKHQVTEIKVFEHPESRLLNQDLVSDKPGRDFESMGTTRHMIEPKISPKKHEFTVFAQELANFLEKERNQGAFHSLYIAASPALLGLLRQSFNPNTAKLIKGEIDKDITHLKTHEIASHLSFFF